MRFNIYKPTKTNKGSACSFNVFTSREKDGMDGIWLEIVKQNGWNEKSGNGIFKDGEKVSVKLNWNEVSNIKRCLEKNREKSLVHDFGGTKTVVMLKAKMDREKQTQNGFSFSVKKGDDSFYIGLTFDEAVGLIEWFDRALSDLYANQ